MSSFPPRKCGVASYAAAHEKKLRENGDKVGRFTFQTDGEAAHRFTNDSIAGLFGAMVFFLRHPFDEVYLHFTEELVWPKPRTGVWHVPTKILQFVMTYLLALSYGPRLNIYVHEITNTLPAQSFKRKIRSHIFSKVRTLAFHTEAERENFLLCYGTHLRSQTQLVAHEANFEPAFKGSKAEARKQLNLSDDHKIFLCIGFIAPHKGIEDAIAGFRNTKDRNFKLIITGSLRTKSSETSNYLNELKKLIEPDSRIELRYGYLSDLDFDTWLKASDYVILPYKEIWSSGVGARASTLGTPIIARDLPNLKSQMRNKQDVVYFEDVAGLSETIDVLNR